MAQTEVKTATAQASTSNTAKVIGRLIESGILIGLMAALYFGLFRDKSLSESFSAFLNVLAVIVGIGFLIFIHELGHFLAAKWCDVQVETFSVGFGRAIPGCSYKWGETVYKLAMFPIGGYVKMLGQTDPGEKEEDQDAAVNSPRSYMNKTVGQRLFIISAGVVMNLLFGFLVFIYIYLVGKTEPAPFFGYIEPGSPADLAGLRAYSEILEVDQVTHPSYEDLFYASLLSTPGETKVHLKWRTPDGHIADADVIPRKLENELRPTMGVGFPVGVVLFRGEKPDVSPADKKTPAAEVAFRGGDRIIAIRPALPDHPQFLPVKHGPDLVLAESRWRNHPLVYQVKRNEQTLEFTVQPGFLKTLGFQLQMGKVSETMPTKMPPSAQTIKPGDLIIALNAKTDFDPLRLPDLVQDLADRNQPIELTIQRDNTTLKVAINPNEIQGRGTWVESAPGKPVHPMPFPALGLNYQVLPVIARVQPGSDAAQAGMKVGHTIVEITIHSPELSKPQTIAINDKNHFQQAFWSMQLLSDVEVDIHYKDETHQVRVCRLMPKLDPTWSMPTRGLKLENETSEKFADGFFDAVKLGLRDTKRFVIRIYMNLYSFVTGKISFKLLSGPVDMARATYQFAERGFKDLLHFLAMISINLAIVNFLPIPVLDGGHAVLLVTEKLRGKPMNERVLTWITLAGLAFILCLMLFVTALDITKMDWFQNWFNKAPAQNRASTSAPIPTKQPSMTQGLQQQPVKP